MLVVDSRPFEILAWNEETTVAIEGDANQIAYKLAENHLVALVPSAQPGVQVVDHCVPCRHRVEHKAMLENILTHDKGLLARRLQRLAECGGKERTSLSVYLCLYVSDKSQQFVSYLGYLGSKLLKIPHISPRFSTNLIKNFFFVIFNMKTSPV